MLLGGDYTGFFYLLGGYNKIMRSGIILNQDNNTKTDIFQNAFSSDSMEKEALDLFKDLLFEDLSLCMKAAGAMSGSIFLFDKDQNELVLAIAKNSNHINLEGSRKKLGEGISGKVALERRPLLVKDIENEIFYYDTPKYDHYQSKSFLSIPLEYSGDLIGVVNITDKSTGIPFNDEDLLRVLNISKYLGISIASLNNFLEKQKLLVNSLTREIETLKDSMNQSKKFSSLGKLVGNFVHEINNPLDGIIRYINLTLNCLDDKEVAKKYLSETKEGLSRITVLVRSLLDFCWSLTPQKRKIDINRSIEEVLYLFKNNTMLHNIVTDKKFALNLPKVVDSGLKIVFTNIIKNAYHSMKEKGGVLTIETSLKKNYLEFRFSDTGIGIPANIQGKIFDPFFTTKRMGEGTGLGLAITKEIIENYNGKVELISKENEGATFIIQIPFIKESV